MYYFLHDLCYIIIDLKRMSVRKTMRVKIYDWKKGRENVMIKNLGTNIEKRVFRYQLWATVSNKVRYNPQYPL